MTKKILVVDDDLDISYTVKHGLEGLDSDYEVIAVDCGYKCLEMLKNDEIPDLILLDIMMPEMTGWETYNQIKEIHSCKDVPVIFLTARKDRVAENAGKFLAEDYIEKPFDLKDLKARIDKILK